MKLLVLLFLNISFSNFCEAIASQLWKNLDNESHETRQQIFQREIFTDSKHFPPLYQAAYDLQKLLEFADIEYICAYGAALGTARFGELNPWDDDIDFALSVNDESKLKNIVPLAKKLGYNLFPDDLVGWKFYKQQVSTNEVSKEIHHNVFVDLFLYKHVGDKYNLVREKGRKLFTKAFFTKREFETRTILPLGPLKVPCSTYTKDLLIQWYGEEYMSTVRFYFTHTKEVPVKYTWTIKPSDKYPSYKNVPIEKNRLKDLFAKEKYPSDLIYATKRLIACPATINRVSLMADILNEDSINENEKVVNGRYYENGEIKGENWIAHKVDLILNKLITKCEFFYPVDNPNKIACVVGRDIEKNESSLFYFTDIAYQGKGLTIEAIKAFLSLDIYSKNYNGYDVLKLSIHPDNEGSIAIAKKIGAIKMREGFNYSLTQPRHFYEISKKNLIEKINNW